MPLGVLTPWGSCVSCGDAVAPGQRQREESGLEVRQPGFCLCSATSVCSRGLPFLGSGLAGPFLQGAALTSSRGLGCVFCSISCCVCRVMC